MIYINHNRYRVYYPLDQIKKLQEKVDTEIARLVEHYMDVCFTEQSLDNLGLSSYKAVLLRDMLEAQSEASIEMALVMGLSPRATFKRVKLGLDDVLEEFLQLQCPQVQRW